MYEVYAYWNVQQLWTVFNAAAALTGNSAYQTLLFSMLLLGFLVIMGVALARFRAEQPIVWIVFLVLFYGTLFVPKTTVDIIDRTGTTAPMAVPNVPLGLAFFASTTSHIGDWLTRSYEALMTIPAPVQFAGNGMMFGDRILRAATQSVALDPQFNNDLMDYVRNCVAPDLLDGSKDLNTLMQTEEIWTYMGSPNPARATSVNGTSQICTDAYTLLNTAMTAEVTRAHENVARRLNPEASQTATPAILNALLAAQIPVASTVLMGVTTADSYDMVRQAMMVNLWSRVPRSIAQAVSDPVAGQQAIANTQATASSEASYLSMANIAEGTLPKIRNSIQVIGIAVFPIILLWILMAGQNGGVILRTYVGALMWIELWPPLYAVVNFVMQSSSHDNISAGMVGYLSGPATASGINMQNMGNLAASVLSDQAIGGMMTLTVPMIALILVTGTMYALTGAVSQMMAPAAAAAQRFGGEAGVGNLNMGNVRYDTFAARTHDANSYRSSGSVDTGGMNVTSPTNTNTNAYGSVSQPAGDSLARSVATARVTNLGAGLTESATTSAGNTRLSSTGMQASTSTTSTNTDNQSAGFTHAQTADFARRFSDAVGNGIRTQTGHGSGWQSAVDRTASQDGDTRSQESLRESGNYVSGINVGAKIGESGGVSQSNDGPYVAPGSAGSKPSGEGTPAGPSSQRTQIKQDRGFGLNVKTGGDFTAADDLAYTARTGASNKYGLNQQQSARILREAFKTAEAGTRDEGTRAAGESFMANLQKGYTTNQITSASFGQTSQASDQRSAGHANSIGTSMQFDSQILDYFTQKSGLPPAQAARALTDLRGSDPAAFATIANEARASYSASPQGQAALDTSGVAAPATQDQVLGQGQADVEQNQRDGARGLAAHNAANQHEVAKHQAASPRSAPSHAGVDRQYQETANEAYKSYNAQSQSVAVQRGVGQLTQQATQDQHGATTAVQIAFAGWTIKSPDDIAGRIQYVAQHDPAVAAQLEHLGTLPKPTENQLKSTAEMVEASYARQTK